MVAARNRESETEMKPNCKISRGFGRCCAGLAVAGLVLLPGPLAAQDKGATKLMQLKPIKMVQDADGGQADDRVAMSCPKCKDTWVTVVEKPIKTGAKPTSLRVLRHECPRCENKYLVEGHGKDKTQKIAHVCRQCGSEDIFCCRTRKGEGPTPGMAKEHR